MSLPKFAVRRRGFTLIELLIVIVVIAILALIVIPRLMGASRKAKDSTLRANMHVIRTGIEQFQADTGMYPHDLDQLYAGDDALGGTADDTTVPNGTYKGPYGTASSGVIDSSVAEDATAATIPLPANPYIASSVKTVVGHWAYTLATDGKSYTLHPAVLTGNDASDTPYADY